MKSDPVRGCFSSASEYIRDLIRHDYENDERRKWDALKQEFLPGMTAVASEFLNVMLTISFPRQESGKPRRMAHKFFSAAKERLLQILEYTDREWE